MLELEKWVEYPDAEKAFTLKMNKETLQRSCSTKSHPCEEGELLINNGSN